MSKKPRRVCRPQAANKVRSFSAGACTWQKIPYRLQVCELSAKGGQGVRAADCNPLVKKGQWPFLTVWNRLNSSEFRRFPFQLSGHKMHQQHTHEHGVHKGKSVGIHINSVSQRQKPEPGKNRDGIGKRRPEGFLPHGDVCFFLGLSLKIRSPAACVSRGTLQRAFQFLYTKAQIFSIPHLMHFSRQYTAGQSGFLLIAEGSRFSVGEMEA